MRTDVVALVAVGASALACARPLKVRAVADPASVPSGASVVALSTRSERRAFGPGYQFVDGVVSGPGAWRYRPAPDDRIEYTRELHEGDPTPPGGRVVHRLHTPELAAGIAFVSVGAASAILFNATCPRGTVESFHDNEASCAYLSLFFGAGFGAGGLALIAVGLRGSLRDTAAARQEVSKRSPIVVPLLLPTGGGALIGGSF
jgi:hypothetical protein